MLVVPSAWSTQVPRDVSAEGLPNCAMNYPLRLTPTRFAPGADLDENKRTNTRPPLWGKAKPGFGQNRTYQPVEDLVPGPKAFSYLSLSRPNFLRASAVTLACAFSFSKAFSA